MDILTDRRTNGPKQLPYQERTSVFGTSKDRAPAQKNIQGQQECQY